MDTTPDTSPPQMVPANHRDLYTAAACMRHQASEHQASLKHKVGPTSTLLHSYTIAARIDALADAMLREFITEEALWTPVPAARCGRSSASPSRPAICKSAVRVCAR